MLVRASLVAQMVKDLPAMQETWVQSLGQEDASEKGMVPTPVFLPGEKGKGAQGRIQVSSPVESYIQCLILPAKMYDNVYKGCQPG